MYFWATGGPTTTNQKQTIGDSFPKSQALAYKVLHNTNWTTFSKVLSASLDVYTKPHFQKWLVFYKRPLWHNMPKAILKTCPRSQGSNICLPGWPQQLVLITPSMLKRLVGENKRSSNAVEDVKLACTTAGLTQRKAHARDCGMHLGKKNCLNVKYNTQDEMQSSILKKNSFHWKVVKYMKNFNFQHYTERPLLSPYKKSQNLVHSLAKTNTKADLLYHGQCPKIHSPY